MVFFIDKAGSRPPPSCLLTDVNKKMFFLLKASLRGFVIFCNIYGSFKSRFGHKFVASLLILCDQLDS